MQSQLHQLTLRSPYTAVFIIIEPVSRAGIDRLLVEALRVCTCKLPRIPTCSPLTRGANVYDARCMRIYWTVSLGNSMNRAYAYAGGPLAALHARRNAPANRRLSEVGDAGFEPATSSL